MKDKQLFIEEEATRCLLCLDAPCSQACSSGDPARMLRASRFDNANIASQYIANCSEADLERAEAACIHYDRPIRISEVAKALPEYTAPAAMPSLAIDFCGIHCENPFFLASSAVCTNYEMVARALKAGWAGVYYKSICVQNINEVSPRFDAIQQGGRGDFYGFRNMEQLSENPVDMDFDIMHRLKTDFPSKVIIASIMGQTDEQWIELAQRAERAGLDAVELNFSCPQMSTKGMGSDVGQNTELVEHLTAIVKQSVSIPVIPKMTPNITHMAEPATAAARGGADAISAINTIKSVTTDQRAAVNGQQMVSGYSGRAVKPIALRFILEMAQSEAIKGKVALSGIGGIENWHDALEFIKLGCSNVQICTAVMQYGYRIIDDLKEGLSLYMAQHGIEHLNDIVGEALPQFIAAEAADRSTVVFPKVDKEKCIGCGRCYISCSDAGHQAIVFNSDRMPAIQGARCVGCQLCSLVCPVGAISQSKRVKKKAPK